MSRGDDRRPRREPASAGTPAHVHGGRRRVRVTPERGSLVRRVPVVLALVLALGGAVVVDERGGADPTASAPTTVRLDRVMPASAPADEGSSTWFCAAGTARPPDDVETDGDVDPDHEGSGADGGGESPDGESAGEADTAAADPVATGAADHYVHVLNPTGDDLAATLTVFTGGPAGDAAGGAREREPVTVPLDLPAGERVEVRLGDHVEAPLAAALVEVDGGDVAVEHSVTGQRGADTAPCVTSAATTWHLAWGATTRDATDTLVLFNPFPSSATVDAVFMTEDGGREPVRFQGLPVPARSVVGVDLGHDVTRSELVAATVEARVGTIVVEHLQAYDGSLGTAGLALTPAAPAPRRTWVFAEGAANATAPTTPDPGEEPGDASDEAAGDDTADDEAAAGDEPAGSDDAAGERRGASDDDSGSRTGGDRDGDDEDPDQGPADDEPVVTERIAVYNPGDERARVDVSVVPGSAEPVPTPPPFGLSIAAGGVEVLDYGEHDRIEPGAPHATVVTSTNGVPVVAERVLVDRGTVPDADDRDDRSRRSARAGREATEAGDDAGERPGELAVSTGALAAAPTWRFASLGAAGREGTVSFVVFNPDAAEAVEAEVDLVGGGAVPAVEVPPGTRVTVELEGDDVAEALAAVVTADGPVVVERIVRTADGRRVSAGPGVPAVAGALLLDELAGRGPLGGVHTDEGPDG